MNQTKGITEEEIRTSSDQWWWIQDEFDNREMNDPDCPEDFEPVYHICRCMADSEGVCSTCFNMPAFGATNRAAWLYENGFISGTATKRDIKNEAFLITPEAREAGKKAADELMSGWAELTNKNEYDLMIERGIPPEIADKWMKEINSERR